MNSAVQINVVVRLLVSELVQAKISRRSRSPKYAELNHFMLLCRERPGNLQRFRIRMHSHFPICLIEKVCERVPISVEGV